MILALFARLGVDEAEGFDHIHGLVEATKRALRVRDRVVTDPESSCPFARPLSRRPLHRRRGDEDRPPQGRALAARAGEGDTIWMGAADATGLVVSYIQSLYWEFGSGCVLPRTGVLMQNRGASFSLQRGALNLLAPGRLPFHTLNPALAVLNDGRIMAYGCMGGDGQPQTQAARVHAPRDVSRAARGGDRPPALGARAHLGRGAHGAAAGVRASTAISSTRSPRPATMSMFWTSPIPTSWATPAPRCCIPTARCEGAHDPRADGGAAGV